MTSIAPMKVYLSITPPPLRPQPTAPAAEEASSSKSTPTPKATTVELSLDGLRMSRAEKNGKGTDDIDDSGLPDEVKAALKQVRQLRQKIEEQQAELMRITADTSLSPDEQSTQARQAQMILQSLQSALTTASASLAKLMNSAGLSDEQKTSAMTLAG